MASSQTSPINDDVEAFPTSETSVRDFSSPTDEAWSMRKLPNGTNSSSIMQPSLTSNKTNFMSTDRRSIGRYCLYGGLCIVAGLLVILLLFAAGGIDGDQSDNGEDNQQETWPKRSSFVIVDVAQAEVFRPASSKARLDQYAWEDASVAGIVTSSNNDL